MHPTDGHVEIVPPGFSNELTEATRVERAIARLVSQPESWIGQESRSSRERLRKPDTLSDFAQIGHFIGFRVDTLASTPQDTTVRDTL